MKSKTNNLFESYNMKLNETKNNSQDTISLIAYGTIGADSTYPYEETLEDLIRDCKDAAKTRYNIDVDIKDSGEKPYRNEYKLIITGPKEATIKYVLDYFYAGEEEIFKEVQEDSPSNLTEPTEIINEEEKSIYDYNKEDIESMNLDEMIKLYSKICIETDMDVVNLLRFLNNSGCLNTGSFRNMLEETIEYMHFND